MSILLLAALIGLNTATSTLPDVDPPSGPTTNCTAAWLIERERRPLAKRYVRGVADAFGRQCLGVAGPRAIDWPRVVSDLEQLIPDSSPLAMAVPVDIAAFCPGYAKANAKSRAIFWRNFAVAVIKPEAGTNANAIMWEQPRKNGRPVGGEYSIGLLQLSLSNNAYGCEIPYEAKLLDQTSNLACGVKIMEKLIARNGIGGTKARGNVGLASYWSTVRTVEMKPAAAGKRETRQPIIDATKSLQVCRAR